MGTLRKQAVSFRTPLSGMCATLRHGPLMIQRGKTWYIPEGLYTAKRENEIKIINMI
jgi:hypothetical protein